MGSEGMSRTTEQIRAQNAGVVVVAAGMEALIGASAPSGGVRQRGWSPAPRSVPVGRTPVSEEPVLVEVLAGSTSSIGRSPARAWLVQLRRGSRGVVVAIGLSRTCASRSTNGSAMKILPVWTGEETTREDLRRPFLTWAGRTAGRVTTKAPCGSTTSLERRPDPRSQDRSHAGCPPATPPGWPRRCSTPRRSRSFPRTAGEVSSRGSGAAGASGRLLSRPAPEQLQEEGCR